MLMLMLLNIRHEFTNYGRISGDGKRNVFTGVHCLDADMTVSAAVPCSYHSF